MQVWLSSSRHESSDRVAAAAQGYAAIALVGYQLVFDRGPMIDLGAGVVSFHLPSAHTTAEQDDHSLSIVVVVQAPSRLTVLLNLIRYYAGQSPQWRAPSYGGWGDRGETSAREGQSLTALMVDLGDRLRTLPAADAYRAWLAEGYTVGTQSEYPMSARYDRYIRLPNSSVRMEGRDSASGDLNCVVSSGPIDGPQAQTVLALNDDAVQVMEWILATRAAFKVDDVSCAFEDIPREEVENLLTWLARAALIRPVPVVEWDLPRSS